MEAAAPWDQTIGHIHTVIDFEIHIVGYSLIFKKANRTAEMPHGNVFANVTHKAEMFCFLPPQEICLLT